MKLVYTSDNFMLAGRIQSLLESNKIQCFMKNASLTGGIGELPANECWPEVWVNHDEDEKNSQHLIEAYLSESKRSADWKCNCGEMIEGQFTECWKCGNELE